MSRFANAVEVNTGNSVRMIRNDYSDPWLGVLREAVQNSTDGWGENGRLEDGHPLSMRFAFDPDKNVMDIADNAGGMSEEVLRDNLVAIDNPSEAKSEGDGAGAYGRGFWVIASSGRTVTVEVKHEGRILQTKVDPYPSENEDATYDDIVELDEPDIGNGDEGTFYHIEDVLDADAQHFKDWPTVEEAFVRNFAPLLDDDRVTIEYAIGDDEHTVEGPDMDAFRASSIHEEAALKTFNSQHADGSGSYTVRDLVVVDATDLDVDAPWNTVVGWKGNAYLDYPFMKVSEYRPYNVPSMSKPADMFGWCDVSEFCPEQESNAHDDLNVKWGERSGLKQRLEQLHAEHFQTRVTTEERNELKEAIIDNINDVLSDVEKLSDMAIEGDGPEGDVDGPGPSSRSNFLVCKADAKEVDVGQRIQLFGELNFPVDLDYDSYEIRGMKVRNISEELTVRQWPDTNWDATPNQHVEHHLAAMAFNESGRYSLSGQLVGIDENGEAHAVDRSHTIFTVGDVEPPEQEQNDDDGAVQYVTNVKFFENADAPRKTFAQQDAEDDGLTVSINLGWPEAQRLKDDYTGDAYKREQRELCTRWGLDEVVNYRYSDTDWSDEGSEQFEEYLKLRDHIDKIRGTHDF